MVGDADAHDAAADDDGARLVFHAGLRDAMSPSMRRMRV
jgi:hypothetical protein